MAAVEIDSAGSDKDGLPVSSTDVEKYPLTVHYCGVCSMPTEYCEYSGMYDKCQEWLRENLPDEFDQLSTKADDASTASSSKRQTRGGKAIKKARKKQEVEKLIKVSKAQRNKKKIVTVITGLRTFEIDLKKASKICAQHFSCGSSVTGDDEVVVQGDVTDDIFNLIQKHWPEVDDDGIELVSNSKR